MFSGVPPSHHIILSKLLIPISVSLSGSASKKKFKILVLKMN